MAGMQPFRQDALMAAVVFGGGLVLLAGGAYVHRGTPAVLLAPPLAVASIGVAVRRRAPVTALVLGVVAITADVLLGPSLGTVLVFTDNIYAAALYGPRRLATWLLGVTSVLAVVVGAVSGFAARNWAALAIGAVQGGLVLTTPAITAVIVRQHRDQAIAERARADQTARLAGLDRQAAVAAERARMARELHDLVANHFSAVAIQAAAVMARNDLDDRTVRSVLASIRENSVRGMAEMRTMIGLLRAEGDDPGLVEHRLKDLADLVERSRRAGMRIELNVSGTPRDLAPSVELAGYRILREALTNALRHGTGEARVTVDYGRAGEVVLSVRNPVSSTPTGLPGSGTGLVGLEERAALVGGSFSAGAEGDGWAVSATLPADGGQARDGGGRE
ncbi:two-component sensor histidine kinase [Sphaerisporangium melleum]|uniref:histidine kinase n=1 Tax=Sphaerisporangium melleum TaxID=321316 RepID=A0A917R660_9ACTN|nr:histidine kinase [Sphaerisporangium melleum]GGK91918.1 two-component sensor histidine kinase [Sphaerisporangium melleum]GII72953.1 two-component sensor histidine kinase [Sphaerisporangium melleum]